MAKGSDPRNGPSVMQVVESCLQKLFATENSDQIKTFAISRTDAKVHAIRSPILIGLPVACDWFSQSELARTEFLLCFNDQIRNNGFTNAIELLHVDPVAMGFHPCFHVSYRRYVYRLRVISTEQSLNYPNRFFAHLSHVIPSDPSLASLSEFNYSWTIPPTFNIERAQFVCDLLKRPGQNFASFFLHQMRQRINNKEYKSVTRRRQLLQLNISKGEPYHDFTDCEDEAQFYNLDFVGHGFMRQQVLRGKILRKFVQKVGQGHKDS
ncbi:hypothetical protein niasHT_003756 [Heterodera trifolii]|uniref:Uncharacterized protein n=1 Tax=Heterodera trifolii TaxID=157864 RepID=A0ABD2LUP4_9BILA